MFYKLKRNFCILFFNLQTSKIICTTKFSVKYNRQKSEKVMRLKLQGKYREV